MENFSPDRHLKICSVDSFCLDDADEGLNDHDDGSIKENFREQDIYLPIANVARIMKNAVPQTGKVSSQRGGDAVSAQNCTGRLL